MGQTDASTADVCCLSLLRPVQADGYWSGVWIAEDVLAMGQTEQLLEVVPVKEEHRLELQWAVPAEQRVYRAAPCGYLGHLLGSVTPSPRMFHTAHPSMDAAR